MTVAPIPSSPAERLAVLIDGLCAAVAAHGARGLLTLPLLLVLWSRLRRMAVRARRLGSRIAAGAPLSPRAPRAAPRSKPSAPYLRLPRGVTWLVRVVPGTAAGAATLQFLLDDPEMAAVADLPPMRRLLPPLCRMLGVKPPPPPLPPPAPHSASPPAAAPVARASAPPGPHVEPVQPTPPTHGPPAPPIAASNAA